MQKLIAFVAMKFDAKPWKDRRYNAICDVLIEAGYEPIRSDQLKTSGPVVEEVCRLLKSADLVVLDSTGNSHSVSYEIGFCHGVNRPASTTILLRKGNGADIPFNYGHYRHRCYARTQELKQQLRDFFSLTTPISDEQRGYVLTFDINEASGAYGAEIATVIVESISKTDFSGRCEYWVSEGSLGSDRFYWVALGLKYFRNRDTPNYEWYQKLQHTISRFLESTSPTIKITELSEIASWGECKFERILRGVGEVRNGSFISIVGGPDTPESWFLSVVSERLEGSEK